MLLRNVYLYESQDDWSLYCLVEEIKGIKFCGKKVNVIPVTSKNAATCLMSGIMTSTDDCELRKISSNPFPTMVFMWKIIFSIAQISRHQAGKF